MSETEVMDSVLTEMMQDAVNNYGRRLEAVKQALQESVSVEEVAKRIAERAYAEGYMHALWKLQERIGAW